MPIHRRDFLQGAALGTLAASQLLWKPGRSLAATAGDPLARRRLLFVDDLDVLYRSGCRRFLRPLDRYSPKPVVAAREKPWEIEVAWNSVYRNPTTGLYQMWYQAYSGKQAQDKSHRCAVCYAESQDGLHWDKPNLGLYSYNGIKETNIVMVGNGGMSVNYCNSVVVDPAESDPEKRYKMAFWDFFPGEGGELPGLAVAFSPDGIKWTKHPAGPLLVGAYVERGTPLPYMDDKQQGLNLPLSFSDAMDVIYDDRRSEFAIYHKMWVDGPDGKTGWKHLIGRTCSKDFVHWSKPELVFCTDDLDPLSVEFHHCPVFAYNGRYFGLAQILNRDVRGGTIDIELVVSEDGFDWHRPFRDKFFLPKNEEKTFDGGNLTTNASPVFLDDEVRFYYGGGSEGATSQDVYAVVSGIGLATMPRDRFAGLRAVDGVGQITTRPIEFGLQTKITLNAVASEGAVLPELLDVEGRLLRGFTKDDAAKITGDSLAHPTRWRGAGESQPPAGKYLLRIHLAGDAEVFAASVDG